jgi:hypothetical protein
LRASSTPPHYFALSLETNGCLLYSTILKPCNVEKNFSVLSFLLNTHLRTRENNFLLVTNCRQKEREREREREKSINYDEQVVIM